MLHIQQPPFVNLSFQENTCADFMEPVLLCYLLNNYTCFIEHNMNWHMGALGHMFLLFTYKSVL